MKYKVTLNGKVFVVNVHEGEAEVLDEYEVGMAAAPKAAPAPVAAAPAAAPAPKAEEAPAAAPAAPVEGGEPVNSPLPGSIVEIVAKVGDTVKNGQPILILEAMKMENEILAPKDGVIAQILVERGQFVNNGDVLAVIS
ncbi:MAG: biotin/lipoyl-binding protein [Clostridiales bacterium]|nr:biotin/lipoyl-binding protein [Clostridiales bacterium]